MSRVLRRVASSVMALACLAPPVDAQESPSVVAQAYFDAVAARDWARASGLVSQDAASRAQAEYLDSHEQWVQRRRVTVADIRAHQPSLTASEAEERARRFREFAEEEARLFTLPPDSARSMAPREFAAWYLMIHDGRQEYLEWVGQTAPGGLTSGQLATYTAWLDLPSAVVGEFKDGDTTTWVAYRQAGSPDGTWRPGSEVVPDLLRVELTSEGWRVAGSPLDLARTSNFFVPDSFIVVPGGSN